MVAEVDRFFDYMEIPKDRRLKLVAYQLKRAASARWERLSDSKRREGKG